MRRWQLAQAEFSFVPGQAYPEARHRLGEKALIGLTTFNALEAAVADPGMIDFIGRARFMKRPVCRIG